MEPPTILTFAGLSVIPWLSAALAAPSAHNSQPWVFQPFQDGINLRWDRQRQLPHGDPKSSYLMTGLGAAAESMVIMAAAEGVQAQVHYDFRPEIQQAASLSFSMTSSATETGGLAPSIPRRQTTRLPFGMEQVSSAILTKFVEQAESQGCQLSFVTANRVAEIADLVFEGTARNLADQDVYREFYGWLRLPSNESGPVRDGLPLESLSLGRVRSAVAPLVFPPNRMRLLARVGLHRPMAAIQARLVKRAPVFGLLTGPSDTAAGHFTGGRALLRVWLAATRENLRVHPMTAPMDHQETRVGLADTFGIPHHAPMVACFRLGYGPLGPPAPRPPIEERIAWPTG